MGYLLINFCVGILFIKDGRSAEWVGTFSMNFPQFIGPTLPYQHLNWLPAKWSLSIHYHFPRLLELLEVVEEEAGVAGLRDGHVEGVVEHEDVVAVEVAAEEPVAVVEDGLDDAALYGETAIRFAFLR